MSRDRETIALLRSQNAALTKALRKFVAWYDRNEPHWPDEYRGMTEFYDLRDARDAARAALMGVA